MASMIFLQTLIPAKTVDQFSSIRKSSFHDMCVLPRSSSSAAHLWNRTQLRMNKKKSFTVVAAVGDVSSEGTTYLIAGAAAVALLGTAFPILFSRRDTCPECDGAGFVRKAGSTLRANAARKDQAQIVCARCNGLGKLNQIDK